MTASIDAGAAIGGVRLRVSDLERSLTFYADVLGLDVIGRGDATASLGAGGRTLVTLRELSAPVPRPRHSTGLYHFALLVPDRAALGQALARLAAARWPLQGASDHGVSEALYLADPDGIGIEIYRDRPRERWPLSSGHLEMITQALDVGALLDEARAQGDVSPRVPAFTRMGHVHLQVRDLDEAHAFYHGALGFDVMQRLAGSALFVSAGGYHHHVGLNTWGVAGAPPQPEHSPGLDLFTVLVSNDAALAAVRQALRNAGVVEELRDDGSLVRDPSFNALLLSVA